jgi:hypothetical protein
MAAARPAAYPLIATEASFSDGTKEGQPTKLPIADLFLQGFAPGVDNILAQYLNGLFNNVAAWLLAHSDELDVHNNAASISVNPASDQNNYSPAGWQDAIRVHFTGFSGDRTVTGFVAPQAGKPPIKFFTSDATGRLLLAYDTTSTAANQIRFGRQAAGQSLYATVKNGDCGVLIYSPAASRWYAFVAPAQRTRVTTAKTITGGGATNHNVALTDDELASDTISLTTTAGSAIVTGFVKPTNPHYKSGVKLLLIGSSFTFNSADVGSTADNRLTVTGGNWAAVNGDMALLHEGAAGAGWVLHPLKPPGAGGGSAENEISATVTADVSDWEPAGWQDATQVTITVTGGPWTLSGLKAPGVGKPRVKRLVLAVGKLNLAYTGPTPANIVSFPQLNPSEPSNVSLFEGETSTIVYANDNKWHALLPARPEQYAKATVSTAGTNNALALGAGFATSAMQVVAGGAGPHVINGIAAPSSGTFVRGHWKLVQFALAGKVAHQNAGASAANRVIVTSGTDWNFAVGDYAMLSYDPVAARWMLFPLGKGTDGLTPVTVATDVFTFTAPARTIYSGGMNPEFTADVTNARDGVIRTCLVLPGTWTTVAFGEDMDPEQVLQYVFNDTGAAYLIFSQFFAGACVAANAFKVQSYS